MPSSNVKVDFNISPSRTYFNKIGSMVGTLTGIWNVVDATHFFKSKDFKKGSVELGKASLKWLVISVIVGSIYAIYLDRSATDNLIKNLIDRLDDERYVNSELMRQNDKLQNLLHKTRQENESLIFEKEFLLSEKGDAFIKKERLHHSFKAYEVNSQVQADFFSWIFGTVLNDFIKTGGGIILGLFLSTLLPRIPTQNQMLIIPDGISAA